MKFIILGFFLLSSMYAQEIKDHSFENGKIIYQQTCVSCHGKSGSTNPYMQLVVKPRKLSKTILTQEQSFQITKEGAHFWGAHSDLMPTFKYVFTDSELEDVSYYIAKAFNPDREKKIQKLLDESDSISKEDQSKMLKTGEKIFNRNCSMCHGMSGNGQSEYVEQSKAQKNFIYPYDLRRTLLTEEQIFLYAKYGGKYWGTMKDDMPSWKNKYDDFILKSVAKYVNEKIKTMK